MSDFVDTLKLAEKAREDIYFEKVNRELIEALHRRAAQEKTEQDTAAGSISAEAGDTGLAAAETETDSCG